MGSSTKDVDRGWAWVVTAANAFAFFIVGGYMKGFGIFFSAFRVEFDAPASLISLVLGVRSAVYAITAPLATSLCDRLTERVVIIAAGVFHFVALIVSSQAQNIPVLIFANGVLGGLAIGCTFGPIQVTIGKYFRRRKSLAMSIVFCGATLGQIVMAPVVVKMLEHFGLRGTLLLYGSFLLHLCIAGMLARPIKVHAPSPKTEQDISKLNGADVTAFADEIKETEMVTFSSDRTNEYKLNGETLTSSSEFAQIKPLMHEVTVESPTTEQPEVAGKSRDKGSVVCNYFLRCVNLVLDFSVCKSKAFLLFVISSSFTFVPFINVMIFLYPRALEKGLSRETSAMLLTIMGACEIVGRFAMGILADVKSLGAEKLYIVLTFLGGCVVLGSSFCNTFIPMAVLTAFIGLFGSAPIVLSLGITVDILGTHKIAKGLGFMAFFHGIFNTITPPVLGMLKDVTGSYDLVFVICGSLMIVGSVIMTIYPVSKKCRKQDSGLGVEPPETT